MAGTSKTPIALITGGSRGLGRSMALHLAERGVDVLFTYRSAATEASEVRERIRALGRTAVALPLDVADSGSFAAFAGRVAAELERTWGTRQLDYLVNNAGIALHASIAETTEAQLDEIYAVHLKAPFLLSQRLLPLIADGGRILNVSSGLTRMTFPGSAAYGAMKAAVEVFTRYLAKELGPRRITANVIAPGAIATDFSGGRVRDDPEVNRMVASMTALGRVGLPDDIGGAVALLLSPEGAWINGQRIEASGGQGL
ncbi:SDR family NAD(P)-dependent oxidoreductase [Anaeromyxobacter sp. PSR-1]|uniref:SDR family NAD(P)-dependent oxidoreductase n=1 Tax=unclassified Anaeromyxobacter TaxID=2620896 RepID=UPI0005E62C55|nr:SDR family oxidoreductase [Anaeromyxobacter sp. PSR-1]GAO01733.1 short-chain type dehydrogenase/reductase [Anaeromyxobacter sp. PSR-1]